MRCRARAPRPPTASRMLPLRRQTRGRCPPPSPGAAKGPSRASSNRPKAALQTKKTERKIKSVTVLKKLHLPEEAVKLGGSDDQHRCGASQCVRVRGGSPGAHREAVPGVKGERPARRALSRSLAEPRPKRIPDGCSLGDGGRCRAQARALDAQQCLRAHVTGRREAREAAASGRVQSVDPSTEAHESVVVGCVMTLGVSRGHAAPAGAGADHFAVRRGVPSNPQTRRLGCGGEIFIRTRALPARACLPCSCVFQPRLRRECATGRVCRPRSSTARKARTRRLSASWWRTASSTTCSPAPRRT